LDNVLKKVGQLATVDDPVLGRKAARDRRQLTPEELGWLTAIGPVLMQRVMEHEAGVPDLPKITLADLPSLK
jgi:hypothetical protein